MENRKTVSNVVPALQGVDMWRAILEESDRRYMQKHILSETSFGSSGYESEDSNSSSSASDLTDCVVIQRTLDLENSFSSDCSPTFSFSTSEPLHHLSLWTAKFFLSRHRPQSSHYFQNNHAMMLAISEHQTGMEVHRDIEVQDPSDPESMMSLTLETKVETEELDTVTTKLEDIDLKSVDEYLDLCLMENTESDIKI
jgi:hypothetical protein